MADGEILQGLLTTESWTNERYKNPRREIFRQYPNGGMALTGILSMLDKVETNDPQYSVYEERFRRLQSVTTVGAAGAGPFNSTAGAALTAGGFTQAAGTSIRIYVEDAALFVVGLQVRVFDIGTTSTNRDLTALITGINLTNADYLTVQILDADWANILNDADQLDKYVECIGSVAKEGSEENAFNPFVQPIETYNLCQIFREGFKMTNTAARTDLKYDKSGPFKKQFLDASLRYFIGMEDAFLWSRRSNYTSGDTIYRRTGGLIWYLEQWELGTVYNNSSSAITDPDDDDKRIINMRTYNNGKLTEPIMDKFIERIFRTTMNKSNEKFVCCGSKFLMALNQLYRTKSVIIQDRPKTDTYGMKITTLTTTFGDLHFYSHPRFSNNPRTNGAAFFIDFNHIKYVHMIGRDTKYLDRVQAKKCDYREDMFITEAGLQVMFPETMMYLEGVDGYEA